MSTLDPKEQRSAFTDALRPPAGHVLGACIGTTYSLEFDAFTAIVLAFVGADLDDDSLHSPPAVLTTIARLRSRLRVFVNAGSLHPPHVTNRLFALYDRVLRPVHVRDAAFHPKTWVLRFDPIARPEHRHAQPLYRVVCASRNVTNSGCWELAVTLNGRIGPTKQRFGTELAAFCRRLGDRDRDRPKELWKLLSELPQVEFERTRESTQDLRFEGQWSGDGAIARCLPRRANRALVISPFIRADFVKAISSRVDDLVVVSTQTELDALPEDAQACLRPERTFVVVDTEAEDLPSMDLHAKLLSWESDAESETLIGSANATGPGWGLRGRTNCEAMVALRPGLRIDDVVRAFVSKSKGELHGWIEEYSRRPIVEDPAVEAAQGLDSVRRLISADQIRATFDRSTCLLTLRCPSNVHRDPLPETVTVEIVPLLQRETHAWAKYDDLYRAGVQFPGVDIQDLSAFALVRLRDVRYEDVKLQFGIQYELPLSERDAEDRDQAIHVRLLEGVDPRALLMNVLDGMPGGTWRSDASGRAANGLGGAGSVLRHATIEKVMEACTADPSRIQEVEAVLRACAGAEDLAAFRQFWTVFKDALKQEPSHV